MINFLLPNNIKNKPSGFCYKCVGYDTKRSVLYSAKDENEDISQKFVEMLEKDIKTIYKKFNFSKKMLPLTEKEQSEFEKTRVCWICQKEFGAEKKSKIIVILLVNFVGLHIIFVICISENQNLLL